MKIEVNDFNLKDTIMSGSCFRVKQLSENEFINVINDRVVLLKQEGNLLYVSSNNMYNIQNVITNYFDLDNDYEKINKELIVKDKKMKEVISKCKGYRIINQDSFEMGISYIISQNNNVKRISKIINELCFKYGEKVKFMNNEYYLFPKYDVLKKLKTEDFRELGVGFRDKYLYDYLQKYNELSDIEHLSTREALNKLMTVKGIGLKVASCILLFGYKRLDTFPIDTWVKHNISKNYNIKDDQKTIEKFAIENYGKYSGLAIQYLFHKERNINNK